MDNNVISFLEKKKEKNKSTSKPKKIFDGERSQFEEDCDCMICIIEDMLPEESDLLMRIEEIYSDYSAIKINEQMGLGEIESLDFFIESVDSVIDILNDMKASVQK